jgi:para-aminobenzoate synthetase component 1
MVVPVTPIHWRKIAPCEPVEVARKLKNSRYFAFLDSGKDPQKLGRYSYLAQDPFGVFRVINGTASWNGHTLDGPVFSSLATLLSQYRQINCPELPPFQTGMVGFLSYEAARLIESVPHMPSPEKGVPDMEFGFYDVVFVHDHGEQQSYILSSGWPEQDPQRRSERAIARADELADKIAAPPSERRVNPPVTNWQFGMDQLQFEAKTAEIVERILRGDLFQANLAQSFRARLPKNFDPFEFYSNLRSISPSTFGAYLAFDRLAIASNSPERFLTLRDRNIEARPIKGTAPRGTSPEHDKRLAKALTESLKDRAENTMIVDLLRNDLSRVAEPHSVTVPVLCGLETYASVHHLVSVVTARLSEPFNAMDLIKAAFPCGSISGAPKIKAMEVIGELEGLPRGIYCGSIGYIGFDGPMDLNVAIRTVSFRDDQASFHAGGGITALSAPHDEYQETLVKAERIFRAFRTPDQGEAS